MWVRPPDPMSQRGRRHAEPHGERNPAWSLPRSKNTEEAFQHQACLGNQYLFYCIEKSVPKEHIFIKIVSIHVSIISISLPIVSIHVSIRPDYVSPTPAYYVVVSPPMGNGQWPGKKLSNFSKCSTC